VEVEAADSASLTRRILAAGSKGQLWVWTSLSVTLCALVTAILLAPSGNTRPDRALVVLLFIGSSVHVASTAYLFTEADVRAHTAADRFRYVWAPIILVGAAATIAAAVPVDHLQWLLLPYFAWQFFHFHKQNLGMVALAASSNARRGPTSHERQALSVVASFGILGLLARPGLLQLTLQTPFSHLYGFALIGFMCGVVLGVKVLLTRPRLERGAGFASTYLMALLFFAPIFLFHSPYAAVAGITIGHGLQYLLLVGLIAVRTNEGKNPAGGLALLINLGLLGGLLLAMASHLHKAQSFGRAIFGVYLGLTMAHFVIDAGIWRLREPFPRLFMSSRVPFLVPPTSSEVG
jgi:hypothetical protein